MSTNRPRDARDPGVGAQAVPLATGVPPAPRQPPETEGPPLVRWLHTPRPAAKPGVWRAGHVPKPPEDPDRLGDRELHGTALLALLAGWLVWSLYINGYLGAVTWPLDWIGLDARWRGTTTVGRSVSYVYDVLFACLLFYAFGRVGNGPMLWRRWRPQALRLLCGRRDIEPLSRRRTLRAAAGLLGAYVVWRLSFNADGFWGFWLDPLFAMVPDEASNNWWQDRETTAYALANLWYALYTALIVAVFAPLGDWRGVLRHFPLDPLRRSRGAATADERAELARLTDFTELRAAGAGAAADRLADEVRNGAMGDVDYARIAHAWGAVRARPTELPAFGDAARAQGAAAFVHPSGDRDLPVRAARHDLLTRQVRIGTAPDEERNPYEYRGEDVALDPAVLGTSLLAVGPPGSGKTGRVIRPVTEALCLHALTGQSAVVAVGTASAGLGPDAAFDIIVRVGDPASTHQLDLYGGASDTDEAAALLAEALVGGSRVEPREAAAVLVQLIGPYQAAYGQLPGVPELRAMLDGAPALLATLRDDLNLAGAWDQQRELDARARQAQRPDDLGPHLADRLALLDRAGFSQGDGARRTRPFSLGSLVHPLRVRVDLPATGHAEAGRIITRLLLAQFTAAVTTRPDRSLFACLVLDDATAAITAGTVRGLTHLRPANAGAVLALRTLDDVPAELRTGLLGAVGCRMAFSGITTWDAEHFARAWGKEWTEDQDITRTPDRSGGTFRRAARGVRKLFTGRETTTESVTVRRVERERWSASELAHRVPPRHAVLSMTSVSGEPGPPVLVQLG
ncbi:type IV secretory system conjugative DNA transfer family protein [Streptomyces litchfieldiae]|uniref:ATP-binding protein n=1 Tax=Streptomyces litchfieldiae TaxID=3075543 RepID=A0ABU2MHN2_9ACTN|nr:ATP-binding protein [Streptomyces sp. DSM 44938]MDT0341102.1 ATP-binding protein [Streptomyces sp. DSM 44938]